MKLLHKAVLVGWVLALTFGAVSGLTGTTTPASSALGGGTHDTGWG